MKVESVRGLRDILPDEVSLWQKLEEEARRIFSFYGYKEIRPPILESAELFSRGVGEATDIVHKEMYVFPDKKGQMLALRPEATAPVVRAYIEHGLYAKGDLIKLYYLGPMFRYEKPQKGRQRQFHQYGVEALGSLDPALDAEVIDLAWHLMERVGMSPASLVLKLNSIGCRKDRPSYREALRSHFSGRKEELCPDCQRRLEENPLRIMDCKELQCQEAIAAAPNSVDYLCEDCRAHFEELLSVLRDLGLSYELDPRLVRGIDYYTRTVFELRSRELGAQDALLGGGRYDDLVEILGGPPTPGVGFAGGFERLVLVLSQRQPQHGGAPDLDVYVVPINEEGKRKALEILARLRRQGVAADLDYMGRSLRKVMSVAARHARHALFLGPEELAQNRLSLKNLNTGETSSPTVSEFLADPRAFLV